MPKRQPAKDLDKFIVRLPPGMRDRIKAKADRAGMSMNEAIVWCLEQHFPAPATLQDRINQLARMVALLKRGNDLESDIDNIVDEIDSTLREVAYGKLKTSDSFWKKVSSKIEEWDLDEAESASDPFDDSNWGSSGGGSFRAAGETSGTPDPDGDPGFPLDDHKDKS